MAYGYKAAAVDKGKLTKLGKDRYRVSGVFYSRAEGSKYVEYIFRLGNYAERQRFEAAGREAAAAGGYQDFIDHKSGIVLASQGPAGYKVGTRTHDVPRMSPEEWDDAFVEVAE
jgi:hypothetical protein